MTEPQNKPHTGGCYCGQVRFRIDGPLDDAVFCHCGQCRKTTGFYMAATRTAKGNLSFDTDEGLRWFRSSDSAERGFCQRCGSPLFWRSIDGPNISITMGALDEPDRLKARAHIYVQDKPQWYALSDDLPKHRISD